MILEPLGAGGMGGVSRVRDSRLLNFFDELPRHVPSGGK